MSSLIKELRDRKVFKVAIVYVIGGWLLMQVADVMFPALGLPEWTITLVVALLIIGFPVALILAWAYEATPDGIRRDPGDVDADRAQADTAGDTGVAPRTGSIAVLPFIDMSPDKDNEYFSDGLTEELLNVLAGASGLDVSSRTSCFTFKGKDVDIPTVAEKLKVAHVVEGSVRKAGNQIRIAAQLIEAASDTHLWSDTYDRELDNIFDIQDDIARKITKALRVRLDPRHTPEVTTDSAKAYDLYLRGRGFYHKFGPKTLRYAIEMFTKATEADPEFARAWCGIADCHSILVLYHGSGKSDLTSSDEASLKAIELAPELAEAYVSRGLFYLAAEQHRDAEHMFEQAIGLEPNMFEAHYHLARACIHQNKLTQALEWFDKAAKRSPDDFEGPLIAAPIYRSLGKHERAHTEEVRGIANAERHLEAHPDNARAYYLGTTALFHTGQEQKANEWAERALAIDPTDGSTLYNVACFYAQAGNADKAFDCLDRGGIHSVAWMDVDPELDPIRDHPRFDEILQRYTAAKS